MALAKEGDQNEAKEIFGFDPPWAGRLDQMTRCGPFQPDQFCENQMKIY